VTLVLFHLGLASAGLLALALVAALALHRWRARPDAGYRLARGIVIGILVLAAGQVGLERSGLAPGVRALLPARSAGAEPAEPAPLLATEPRFASSATSSAAPEPLLSDPRARPEEPAAALARFAWNPETWAPALFWAWLAGCALFLGRTLRGIRGARRLLRASEPLVEPELLSAWNEATRSHPRARGIELRTCDALALPACYGFLRRAVLLPRHARQVLESACLRQVLLHELIHLERRDAWTMCVTELLCALFWFHPAAWWLRRRIDELRELSCDAEVIARAGRPRAYARGLVACAERIQPHGLQAALPSWSGSKSQFSRRIEMLLQKKVHTASVSRGAKLLLGACFALCAGTQLALASVAPQEPPPRASSVTAAPRVFFQEAGTKAETESLLQSLGYVQDQTAAAVRVQSDNALVQATDLVRAALSRHPEDEDLRRAFELLAVARTPRPDTRVWSGGQGQVESWRSADRAPVEFVAKERAELDRIEQERLERDHSANAERRAQELKRYLERQKEYESRLGGSFGGSLTSPRRDSSGSLQAELEDTLRILDQQRAELDRLRKRIEELGSQARAGGR